MNQNRKLLKIDWEELEIAFEMRNPEATHYLNTETGEVEMVQFEFRQDLKEIHDGYTDPDSGEVDWETAYRELDVPDWQQAMIQTIELIEKGLGELYIEIPSVNSREGFRDMEKFIETLPSANLKRQLNNAIRGKGAFRNFKNVLLNYPKERAMWFQYSSDRMRERITDWLSSHEIEAANKE